MPNFFEGMEVDSDEEEHVVATGQKPVEKRPKLTHQQRRQIKKAQEAQPVQDAPVFQDLPERIRDDATQIRNKREPVKQKDIGEGHTLDRRSGMGRVDRVRKEGGGKGNIGNTKDELHPGKYLKEGEEQTKVPEAPKPEEPTGITLEQYYKSKGVELKNEVTIDKRTNKGEVNADWIQKEKLTVLKTKEDRKNSEKNESVQNKPKKVAPIIEPIDQAVFGFGTKKPNEGKSEWRDNEKGRKAHGKVVLNDSDFPALV